MLGSASRWRVGAFAIVVSVGGLAVAATPARAASTPIVSVGDVRVWEGHAKTRVAEVPVTLSQPSASPVTVPYSIVGDTASPGMPTQAAAGADFKAKTGTLTFNANVVVTYVAVVVYGDTRSEGDETVDVALGTPTGADPGDLSGVVTIMDDDDGSAVGTVASVGDVSIHEGDVKTRVVKFTVSLTQPANASVTVNYRIVAGSATGGWKGGGTPPTGVDLADKFGVPGALLFKVNVAGATPVQKIVAVKIVADTEGEGDESFTLVIDSVSGPATPGDTTGVGTIIDNDVPAIATLTVTPAGSGTGTVASSPTGISCPTTCSAPFTGGSSVMLSATPDGSDTFAGWSGACTGTGSCSVTMNSDRGVTATFTAAPPPAVWTQVTAGRDHSCGINVGAAYCWGLGFDGEIGNGTNTTTNTSPKPVSALTSGVAGIAAGDFHTCAVTSTGAAKCWGMNAIGQLGDGTTTNRNTPVTVSGMGSGVAEVSAGVQHSCALTTSGGVYCWGFGGNGQLGNGANGDSSVPVPVSGLSSGVAQVSAGPGFSCAVTTAGAAYCWGRNVSGQLGNGTNSSSNVPVPVSGLSSGTTEIVAGGAYGGSGGHGCALTTGGALSCWGSNNTGQLGDGTNTDSNVPVGVSGLGSGVAHVSAGGFFADQDNDGGYTCAVTTAGAAVCFGINGYGQLGNGTYANANTFVGVTGLSSGVTEISAGTYHVCAVTNTGAAYCWGHPMNGSLGDGGGGDGSSPVAVLAP